jgi:hypothetical protein
VSLPEPGCGGCLIGDFVSQEIAFVRLIIKVFVAIVHHGGVHFLDGYSPQSL